jgi:ATP phosphoribosyltransferase regulatory subunit
MNEAPLSHLALLPTGMRDVLPPEAEHEAKSIEAVMDCFAAHGYQRVKTPLLEFEESLFAGAGGATVEQTFRLMDPESQRMMGLRADTTPQIIRLANTRLAGAPRPLRLTYSGQCLRVRGSHLQQERQIAQAGIELIGHDSVAADAEIILTGADALKVIGLNDISFDLTIPRLVFSLLGSVDGAALPSLTRALDRKDHAAVADVGGSIKHVLLKLLEAVGPADKAISSLLAIDLPPIAREHAIRMAETVEAIWERNPTLKLTLDPVEFRGYQYHTGICVTVFAHGRQLELGRGGSYLCGEAEHAMGITLYPDTIVGVAPKPPLRPRLFLQHGTPLDIAGAYRSRNFATIAGLSPTENPISEAIRLGCTHVLQNGKISAVAKES